ncbi:hypothetical protein ACMA5I_00105 [Paracoccaceae bacterium GXU_MW_L88]
MAERKDGSSSKSADKKTDQAEKGKSVPAGGASPAKAGEMTAQSQKTTPSQHSGKTAAPGKAGVGEAKDAAISKPETGASKSAKTSASKDADGQSRVAAVATAGGASMTGAAASAKTDDKTPNKAVADAKPAKTQSTAPKSTASKTDTPKPTPAKTEPPKPTGSQSSAAKQTPARTGTPQKPAPATSDSDDSGSIAGKFLSFLAILLAGGVLALWLGPKLAPHLPQGMAPVAEFLSPGSAEGVTEDELASFREEIEAQIAEAGAASGDMSGEIEAAVSQATENFSNQIAALEEQLASSDVGALDSRISQTENTLQGLSAQLQEFDPSQFSSLSDEAAQELGQFASVVEGMRAQMSDLSARTGAIAQRIEEVEATTQQRLSEAEEQVAASEEAAQAAETRAEGLQLAETIQSAIEEGAGYQEPLGELEALGVSIPAPLSENAGGVEAVSTLLDGFDALARDAISAAQRDVGGDSSNSITGFLQSRISVRSIEPTEGNTPDAILSRVEGHVTNDEMGAAMEEAEALPSAARDVMAEWLERAGARADAKNGLSTLMQSLSSNE